MARLVAACLLALSLAGCSSNNTYRGSPTGMYEQPFTLKDGRTVTCIVYSNPDYEEGGIDCDWQNAR